MPKFANEAGPGYEIISRPSGKILSLKGEWRDEIRKVLQSHNIVHLRISVYAGWKSGTIDFLPQMPEIEQLDIVAPEVKDFTPLYGLPKLRKLNLDGKTGHIDFLRFPMLQELSVGLWSPRNLGSVFQCRSLKNLAIAGYSAADLHEFESLKDSLEGLSLGKLRCERLDGMPELPKLIRLFLTLCPRLQSLSGVERCADLQVLWVERARSLEQIDSVRHLRLLRTLILSGCPRIKSLTPLRGLPALETVGLMETTNIQDGDISVLKTLPALIHAKFVDRPHYTNRDSEFPKERGSFY